ncbi:MAG: Fe-S cluster assembly protein SufD [Muribaculaceae bacterium]|nr:Fe-S cluster assembly protein SufD [Muribaculaceae bacterium]
MTSSLSQYLEFYDANREVIDANSAPAINAMRPDVRKALEGARLPRKGDEGYERTSVEDMLAPDFGINASRMNLPVDVAASFRCDVPAVSTVMGLVLNDTFVPTRSLSERLPDGVKFMSLRQAAIEMPDTVSRLMSLPADASVAAQLNTLLVQDGVFIHIPDGVKLAKPLQLVNILSSPIDLMAVRRVVIEVGDNASAQLLACDHTQGTERDHMSLQVIQITLGRNASFDLCDLEEASDRTRRLSMLYASQAESSRLTVNGSTLSGGMTRNEYTIDLDGERSELTMAGMVIASGSQVADNSPLVRHHGMRTHSNQMFKYVLDGESSGAFAGCIKVDEEAKFTEAYQSNRNLIASADARMHTRPQLEIYCDDVRCSHGATTGQLDAQALFYMRTRGIPEAQARTMLRQAFMADVIDTVPIEGLRDRMRILVERRFNGMSASCADCATCSTDPSTSTAFPTNA